MCGNDETGKRYFYSYEVNGIYYGDYEISDLEFDVVLLMIISNFNPSNVSILSKLKEDPPHSLFTDAVLTSA